MDGDSTDEVPAASVPASPNTDRRRTWLFALAGTLVLLMCSCMFAVFLVLTGIIAEPETVIEQIIRALLGS